MPCRTVRSNGLNFREPWQRLSGSVSEVRQNPIANNAGLQQNGLLASPGKGNRGKRRAVVDIMYKVLSGASLQSAKLAQNGEAPERTY